MPVDEDQPSDKPVPDPSLNLFFCVHRETVPSLLPITFPAVLLFITFFGIANVLGKVSNHYVTFYRKDNCCPKAK